MKLGRDRDLRRRRREAARPDPVADRLVAQAAQRYGAGALTEARGLAEAALKRRPHHPAALNALGIILAGSADYDSAVEKLTEATSLAPEVASFRANLALALRSTSRSAEAVVQAREAVRLEPGNGAWHSSLCTALLETGDTAAAAVHGRVAVRLAPGLADAWHNLGNALFETGELVEAEAAYREAMRLAPSWAEPRTGLGQVCLAAERNEAAMEAFRQALELRRPTRWWPGRGDPVVSRASISAVTNTVKLRHDVEQLAYLGERGRLPPGAERLVAAYQQVLAEFLATHGSAPNAQLTARQWEAIGDAYGRVVVWDPPPPISGSALGSFDRVAAAQQYARPPGISWVDDFLCSDALAALRRFCLEATIWNDVSHNFQSDRIARGYLGAYANDGFVSPLLFQICGELRRALPEVFKDHRLRQMWAYKYEAELQGIGIHGDDAAVNVNFWITPDESNLDVEGGGLLVYPIEVPLKWSFKDMNLDRDRMWRFLDEHGTTPVNVPYRQNRAVIFNSDLFHATAPLSFKPGYENRRINITMLFGRRGE